MSLRGDLGARGKLGTRGIYTVTPSSPKTRKAHSHARFNDSSDDTDLGHNEGCDRPSTLDECARSPYAPYIILPILAGASTDPRTHHHKNCSKGRIPLPEAAMYVHPLGSFNSSKGIAESRFSFFDIRNNGRIAVYFPNLLVSFFRSSSCHQFNEKGIIEPRYG